MYIVVSLVHNDTYSTAMVTARSINRRAPSPPCTGSQRLGAIPSQGPEGIELLLDLQEVRSSRFQGTSMRSQARTLLDKLFQTSRSCILLIDVAEQQILQVIHERLVQFVFDGQRHIVDNSLW